MGLILRRKPSVISKEPSQRKGISKWIEADGPLHYVDYGGNAAGPQLLAVHGLGGSSINWDLLAVHLTPYARLIAIDLPGHGRTPGWGRSTSVHANQRLVADFISEVIDEPVVLVGNSMGGLISVLQATDRPDQTKGVVLISPALPLATVSAADTRTLVEFIVLITPGLGRLAVGTWQRLSTAEMQIERTLRLVMADPTRMPAEAFNVAVSQIADRKHLRDKARDFVEAARSVVATIGSPDYRRRLQSLAVPVLLIHGAHDRLVSLQSATAASSRNPHWRFEVFEHVGHVPQMEDPEIVAQTITDWLGEHDLMRIDLTDGSRTWGTLDP